MASRDLAPLAALRDAERLEDQYVRYGVLAEAIPDPAARQRFRALATESQSKIVPALEKLKAAAPAEPWGAEVTAVEIKDITLPENMQRAMAKEAEAERERRAKIVAAEGEYQAAVNLGMAADIITAHPVALQLRTLQTMAEIATEKNSTIIFPAQFMTTVQEALATLKKDSASS